jgi:hypothetical protein
MQATHVLTQNNMTLQILQKGGPSAKQSVLKL